MSRSIRLSAPLAVGLALAACAPAPERPPVPLAAPTPSAAAQPSPAPIVLRRCDDGGDGGVLIDGICL